MKECVCDCYDMEGRKRIKRELKEGRIRKSEEAEDRDKEERRAKKTGIRGIRKRRTRTTMKNLVAGPLVTQMESSMPALCLPSGCPKWGPLQCAIWKKIERSTRGDDRLQDHGFLGDAGSYGVRNLSSGSSLASLGRIKQ